MKNIAIYIRIICILMCITVITGGVFLCLSELGVGVQSAQEQTSLTASTEAVADVDIQQTEIEQPDLPFDNIGKKGHRTTGTSVQEMAERLIYIGNQKQPAVALTFDDGPSKEPTNRILDVLEQYQVRATFFVMGYKAEKYAEQLIRESALGCEVANHSYDHPQLTSISDKKIINQISKTSSLIKEVTGEITHLVRPPYGAYDDRVLSLIDAPAILWSIDTRDWKTRNAEKTINNVLENVKDGDIILMHDVYEPTAEAVEQLVPELIEMGYQLVTVPELALLKGRTLEKGRSYNRLTAE